jgi:uncharacterized Fe-S cluster-containing radical SAM superfamily protein
VLQVDGYAGYNRLIAPDRIGSDIRLAYCWAHARQKLVEIKGDDEAEEIRRLKKELARVTEERDILEKAAAYFARDAK